MERIVEIEHGLIRPFADQPREYFDPQALKELARSIKAVGLQNPLVVIAIENDDRHNFELVDGQRRWLACGMAGLKAVRAFVRDDIRSQDDQFMVSVVSNFCREGHAPMEIARAIVRLGKRPELAALPRMQRLDNIAEMFGRSREWVYKHERLLRLIPELVRAMDPVHGDKALQASAAIELSAYDETNQRKLLARLGRDLSLRNVRIKIAELNGKKPHGWTQGSGWNSGGGEKVGLDGAIAAVTTALEKDAISERQMFAVERLLRAVEGWRGRRQRKAV
jgi:ParB family transcriptional regulator, chromosome partitioning protein